MTQCTRLLAPVIPRYLSSHEHIKLPEYMRVDTSRDCLLTLRRRLIVGFVLCRVGKKIPPVIVEPTLFSLSFSQSPSLSVSLLFFPRYTSRHPRVRKDTPPQWAFPFFFFLSSRNCVIIFNNVTTIAFSAEWRHTHSTTPQSHFADHLFLGHAVQDVWS